ncbi:hypothetical protein H8S90_11010 [Olivibacter sp. SDN3]|uniref:hypothetical protein n=1 Tax=Olivibacter sp. SDN3 TaxID=2764720 RepID=UPI00165147D1|nr:hypothetical protein [Olivibacter sp. SDN3]QNL52052.1 hypothetical protein H8S90_11010 [Olivibacter sp. SDN3]
MTKRFIFLLPLFVFVLTACDKTDDPEVDIPETIDQTIVRTMWLTTSETFSYKDTNGATVLDSSQTYNNPSASGIHYNFKHPADHQVTRTNTITNARSQGDWDILRENKKDHIVVTWESGEIDKYEVVHFTKSEMTLQLISTEGSNLKYNKDGETRTAARREGIIELLCPCRLGH